MVYTRMYILRGCGWYRRVVFKQFAYAHIFVRLRRSNGNFLNTLFDHIIRTSDENEKRIDKTRECAYG